MTQTTNANAIAIARLDTQAARLTQVSDEAMEAAADVLVAIQHRTAGIRDLRKLLQAERERTLAAVRAELAR